MTYDHAAGPELWPIEHDDPCIPYPSKQQADLNSSKYVWITKSLLILTIN